MGLTIVRILRNHILGIYVDVPSAALAIKGKPDPAAALIAADSVPKTLQLIIQYGKLTPTQLSDALKERMEPILGTGSKDLAAFASSFDGKTLKSGLSITFSASAKGELTTALDGVVASKITSAPLVRALFAVYLGDNPVSNDYKSEVIKGLSKIV